MVNVLLAELIGEHLLKARAERRSRKGIPDLRVELRNGDRILLDCKWDGSARLLEEQLDERLEAFPQTLAVIGVLYPERLRHAEDTRAELEEATDLQWWVHGARGQRPSDRRTHTGSAANLADHLRALPLELEGMDRVAAAALTVGYALEEAADALTAHARISGLVAGIIAVTDKEKDRTAALRIGCLVLFNALAFQDRLAAVNAEVPTVDEARRGGLSGLRAAWQQICDDIDYVPVFEIAGEILDVVADAPAETQKAAFDPLVKAMEDTRRLEGHDLSGRLFHTLLSDAKFTGAYYTSVPAATLLARLVFHDWPPHVDWKDHEFPASLNVADLACGTGTLLMAVASEADRRHREAGGEDATALHKAMVEEALHGFDVQLSAVHFAATSLAMLNPDIQFNRMNLYVMPLGVEGSEVSLGSLDFLGESEAAVQYTLSLEASGLSTQGAQRVTGTGARGAAEGMTATLPELDLAIMNPPFTRSVGGNLLFGSLPKEERDQLQRELSRRLKERRWTFEQRLGSSTPGLAAAFVAAAAPKLRRGEGRLALVLPSTVCTGPSWERTRALIEREFTLDMVIASHDPQRWNFSDSTSLSEVLLIATLREKSGPPHEDDRTLFVNLWENPDGVLDAHRAAQAVTATTPALIEEDGAALLRVDDRDVGEAFSMPTSTIADGQWSGVQFARSDLVRSATRLLKDGEVWTPGERETASIDLCRLDELGQVGPDVRDVRDGFEPTSAVTAYPMVEGNDTEKRRRIATEPNRYLAPLAEARPGRRLKTVGSLWPKAGRLLIAERLRLNTARIPAMCADVPVLSNVWWPVRTEAPRLDKALALWLNSSLGLMTWLATRNTTEGSWVKVKKADLETLPVLDVRHLTPVQLRAMSELFDELGDAEFARLPAMAYCPARRTLDEGISRILGLPDLRSLRALLASEPVVSNQRL
ncbi:MAG: hypothetical protein F4X26_04690 [Chloroflexi bacterium]|nr:hypothetical protein [Chloroflexota bacterium]